MPRTRISRKREELLPWYVNGTLPAGEREAVERWLRRSPVASVKLAEWRQLSTAVRDQAEEKPTPAVWQQLTERVRTQGAARHQAYVLPRLAQAWSGALALIVLLLLWSTIRPGIVLQWSVNDWRLTAFRVYRAPEGSTDFALLHEMAAQPGTQRYTYVDAQLWPGQTYTYRVEGLGESGQATHSQPITASALEALPGQLAILLTGLIVGYGAVAAVQQWQLDGWRGPGLRKLDS